MGLNKKEQEILKQIEMGLSEDDPKLEKAVENLTLSNFSCLLYTSPRPRDRTRSRMPSSA